MIKKTKKAGQEELNGMPPKTELQKSADKLEMLLDEVKDLETKIDTAKTEIVAEMKKINKFTLETRNHILELFLSTPSKEKLKIKNKKEDL